MRAQATIAQLAVIDHLHGDYNKNGVVDAADYVVWRATIGQMVAALSGADGNGNGMIDGGDYTFWRARFGQVAGGNGAGASANAAVPERASALLLLMGLLLMCSRRRVVEP